MTDVRYHALSADDAEAWQRLRLEGVRDFPLGFMVTEEEATAADPERCREILALGGHRGVSCNGQLVGFCGYRPQQLSRLRHRAEIGPFFVTARAQGTLAAATLMRGVIAEAKADGLAQLELFVDTENRRAIAFYEKHGFWRIATHPDTLRIKGQARSDHFYLLRL